MFIIDSFVKTFYCIKIIYVISVEIEEKIFTISEKYLNHIQYDYIFRPRYQ